MKEDYGLIMKFLDQSNSFTFGFQCGKIWQLMEKGYKFENYLFSTNNKKQIEMMCNYHGYYFDFTHKDNEWINLNAIQIS